MEEILAGIAGAFLATLVIGTVFAVILIVTTGVYKDFK